VVPCPLHLGRLHGLRLCVGGHLLGHDANLSPSQALR
jgi:hypothetical protein